MSGDWLPPLVRLEDSGGQWERYIDAVYAVFNHDFIASQPKLAGRWVRCRRDPIAQGKEAGFWHCVSEGQDEAHRVPDLRRCERIAWVRSLIEHVFAQRVEAWVREDRGDSRIHLWFDEQYLVVLGDRGKYCQLITAFCTDRPHTIRKKRQERDACKRLKPPLGDGFGTPSTHG